MKCTGEQCQCLSCKPLPMSDNFECNQCTIGYHIKRVLYLGGLFWSNGGQFNLRLQNSSATSALWRAEMRDWGFQQGGTSGANEYFGIGESPLEAILNLERVMKRVSD